MGGYSDWRLPTRKELKGIVDYGRYAPALDIAFVNFASNNYWSFTTNANNSNNAWIVNFNNGNQNNNNKNNNNYVRCVRAGE